MNLTAETTSVRAYELWEKEGRPDGRDLDHWLTAERMVQQQAAARDTRAAPPPAPAAPRGKGRRPR
jgi:hypothetical protein